MSGSGAEAVSAEGGSVSAPEETLFHCKRRREATGSTEPSSPERLQGPPGPAGLGGRAAVRARHASQNPQKYILGHGDIINHRMHLKNILSNKLYDTV